MSATVVAVDKLVKRFELHVRGTGLRGAVRGLLRPQRRVITAVDEVSFALSPGEIVGWIGPNGAGKSTTLKVLCGVLWPSSGRVEVCGLSPQRQRRQVARRLGVVFGQRSQLYWDLRLGESFELMRRIYQVEPRRFQCALDDLADLLGIREILDVPVRQLSLGQRMRGEIAAAVLHEPAVLLLDEPTIGLDIAAKQAIRDLILRLNEQRGTTVILTSHDLGDVARLCRRLILMNEGRIVEDQPLATLVRKLAPYRLLQVDLEQPLADGLALPPGATLVTATPTRLTVRIDAEGPRTADLISHLASRCRIRDLSVRDPEIEEIMARFYASPPALRNHEP